MKLLDKDGKLTNYNIDSLKYYVCRKTWTCTVGGCAGSIQIKDERYRPKNPHSEKCKVAAKKRAAAVDKFDLEGR